VGFKLILLRIMVQCLFLSQIHHYNDQLLLQALGGSIQALGGSIQASWSSTEVVRLLVLLATILLVLAVWLIPAARARYLQIKLSLQALRVGRRKREQVSLLVAAVAMGGLLYFAFVRSSQAHQQLHLLNECHLGEVGFKTMSAGVKSQCECSVPDDFKGPSHHHFVEIGADNGLYLSNSFFFEKIAGWKGLCVEPRPDSYKELVVNRPDCINVNAVISNTPGPMKFYSFGQGTWHRQMSGLEGANSVTKSKAAAQAYAEQANTKFEVFDLPSLRFADLFKEHGFARIEVAFIDVEGAELQVLQTIDFDTVKIHFMVLEQAGPEIQELLNKNGFARMRQPNSWDTWFVNSNW